MKNWVIVRIGLHCKTTMNLNAKRIGSNMKMDKRDSMKLLAGSNKK